MSDSAAGEIAEWLDAQRQLFERDAAGVLAFFDQRNLFDLLLLKIVDAFFAESDTTFIGAVCPCDECAVFGGSLIPDDAAKFTAERVNMCQEEAVFVLM